MPELTNSIASEEISKIITVIFDDTCFLCTLLAEYLKNKGAPSFSILKYSDFLVAHQHLYSASPLPLKPENLGLIKEGKIYWGSEAWENIIVAHPMLSSLSWLAQKVGVIKVTAKAINGSSHIIRRLCLKCGR